jgi:hypothetical protein
MSELLAKSIDADTLVALQGRYAAIAILIEIDTSPATYWCSGPDVVVNASKTYTPRDFTVRGIQWGEARRASCTLITTNVDNAVSDLSYTAKLTDGYTLTVRILAKPRWEDAWEAVYTPFSAPIADVHGSADTVTIRASAQIGLHRSSAHAPMDIYCPYRVYKGTRCGYAGPELVCDRSWTTCNGRGNGARFGGHRFAPRPGQVIKIGAYGYQTVPSDPYGGGTPLAPLSGGGGGAAGGPADPPGAPPPIQPAPVEPGGEAGGA